MWQKVPKENNQLCVHTLESGSLQAPWNRAVGGGEDTDYSNQALPRIYSQLTRTSEILKAAPQNQQRPLIHSARQNSLTLARGDNNGNPKIQGGFDSHSMYSITLHLPSKTFREADKIDGAKQDKLKVGESWRAGRVDKALAFYMVNPGWIPGTPESPKHQKK